MSKIVYIVSNIDRAISFEWIYDALHDDFDLAFIFLGPINPKTAQTIENKGGKTYYIQLQDKKGYLKAGIKLLKTLKKLKPDIVHTHLRDADILGLSISKLLGVKKRITTRHFSTYNHLYHKKSVKIDKIINSLATDIIAISNNVKTILKLEGVKDSKISLIPHGFDLIQFKNVELSNIEYINSKYNPLNNRPVIGVISRFIQWKGHTYIIKAYKELLSKYPDALLVLANANGPDKDEILKELHTIPEKNYVVIPFEEDIFSLYQIFDVFVHAPMDDKIEAFGQVYIEALAAGIPSVFTLSGIAPEFIKDHKNAIVVKHKNVEQIFNALNLLLDNTKLKEELISNGEKSVDRFNLNLFINKLKALYNPASIK